LDGSPINALHVFGCARAARTYFDKKFCVFHSFLIARSHNAKAINNGKDDATTVLHSGKLTEGFPTGQCCHKSSSFRRES
jgi:hypothetical protein